MSDMQLEQLKSQGLEEIFRGTKKLRCIYLFICNMWYVLRLSKNFVGCEISYCITNIAAQFCTNFEIYQSFIA